MARTKLADAPVSAITQPDLAFADWPTGEQAPPRNPHGARTPTASQAASRRGCPASTLRRTVLRHAETPAQGRRSLFLPKAAGATIRSGDRIVRDSPARSRHPKTPRAFSIPDALPPSSCQRLSWNRWGPGEGGVRGERRGIADASHSADFWDQITGVGILLVTGEPLPQPPPHAGPSSKGWRKLAAMPAFVTAHAARGGSPQLEKSQFGKGGADATHCVFEKRPIAKNQTSVLNRAIWQRQHRDQARSKMRMNLRTEECRRRAAVCAKKALRTFEEEPRRTFAELAEQWRALAVHAEYLEQYHSGY